MRLVGHPGPTDVAQQPGPTTPRQRDRAPHESWPGARGGAPGVLLPEACRAAGVGTTKGLPNSDP